MKGAEAAGVQSTQARREVGRDENLNAEFFSVLVANGLNPLKLAQPAQHTLGFA
ncbi:MAG: hypothetical protein ACWGP1_14280 [Syntrophobacteria bacterium]